MASLEKLLVNFRNSDSLKYLPIWDSFSTAYNLFLKAITLNRGLSREIYPGIFAQVSYRSRHSIPVNFETIRQWDLPSMEYLERHIKASRNACFMDIGANHGLYSILANSWVGENGAVIAFEPHPKIGEVLKENLAMNNCTHVKIAPFAVGDTIGAMKLFGDSTTATLVNSGGAEKIIPTVVDVISLDEYCHQYSVEPTALKIDVEGFEFEALKGAANTLTTLQDTIKIVCEMHTFMWAKPNYDLEIISFLESCGLRVFTLQGNPVRSIDSYGHYVIAKHFD